MQRFLFACVLLLLAVGAVASVALPAAGQPAWPAQVAGWAAAALLAAWNWLIRNRRTLLLAAGEAVAFAEKFRAGASHEALEDAAVAYVQEYWPDFPEFAVRWAIREICRRRRLRARRLGLAGGSGR